MTLSWAPHSGNTEKQQERYCGRLKQFEDHREGGPVRQTALRSDGAVAHSGEGAFNGVGGPKG
jgi:hypothetical protein